MKTKFFQSDNVNFHPAFCSQHYLIVMIEKRKQCLEKRDSSGALLTDLSKAFDCILCDLLIVKHVAYALECKLLAVNTKLCFKQKI